MEYTQGLIARAELVVAAAAELNPQEKEMLVQMFGAATDQILETFLYLYEEDAAGIAAFATKVRKWKEVEGNPELARALVEEEKKNIALAFS